MEENRFSVEILEIETINYCNNDCEFCPANIYSDRRDHMLLDWRLIEKIARELHSINYNKQINLFSNGEPLLDNRIIDIAKLFREMVPQAKLVIYTNCKLLDVDLFMKLIALLDLIVLNNYQPEMAKVNSIVSDCYHLALSHGLEEKVEIRRRNKKEILTTKGGLAPNKRIEKTILTPCILPFKQMVIKASGNIVLCCNDVFESNIVGNIKEYSLLELWESPTLKKLRDGISMGRENINICSLCDVRPFEQKGLRHLFRNK